MTQVSDEAQDGRSFRMIDALARFLGNTIVVVIFSWTAYQYGCREGYRDGAAEMKAAIFASLDTVRKIDAERAK